MKFVSVLFLCLTGMCSSEEVNLSKAQFGELIAFLVIGEPTLSKLVVPSDKVYFFEFITGVHAIRPDISKGERMAQFAVLCQTNEKESSKYLVRVVFQGDRPNSEGNFYVVMQERKVSKFQILQLFEDTKPVTLAVRSEGYTVP